VVFAGCGKEKLEMRLAAWFAGGVNKTATQEKAHFE
jgi:hypothetical protein